LETVVVTATRLDATTVSGRTATVITSETIDTRHKATVPDLFADVAGLHTTSPGERGSVGEVILRGGEPNFTAVLIDGIQMNDPTNTRGGSFDFSTLDIDEIDSIEIIRGPLSPIYGSDALSGVINVTTRRPSDRLAGALSATLGGDDLAAAHAAVGGTLANGLGYSVSAGTRRDGRSDTDAGYRGSNFSGTLDLQQPDGSSLVLLGRHAEADLHAFPDSSGGPRLAALREHDRRETADDSVGLAWHRTLSERTFLTVRAASLGHEESVVSPGVAADVGGFIPPNRADTTFSRATVTGFLSTAISTGLRTAIGVGYERQDGDSDGEIEFAPGFSAPTSYSLSRENVALFGELAYEITPTLSIDAALRHDTYDEATAETTGKLGLSYALSDKPIVLRVGWAQGFKLPSLFSLGDPLVGNPNLLAESVTSWEIGADVGGPDDRVNLHLTAFSQDFENLIDFDFEQFMSVNRDRVDIDGLEIALNIRVDDRLTILGHGTWVDTDVQGSPGGLRQRPERRGGLGIDWRVTPALGLYAGLRYVSDRLDESIPTGEQTLPSYSRADISLSWQIRPALTLRIGLDNVLDHIYEDAIGFPSLGRRLRASFRAELGSRH